MNRYSCRTVSLSKLIVTPKGVMEPLCQSCGNTACGNPIEVKTVSVFGIPKQWRCYMSGDTPQVVIRCDEGYTKD